MVTFVSSLPDTERSQPVGKKGLPEGGRAADQPAA